MKPSTSMSETGAAASYMSSSSSGSSGPRPKRAALEELRLALPTLPELNLNQDSSCQLEPITKMTGTPLEIKTDGVPDALMVLL